ncbi:MULTISPECIES: F510_1955 family glycosylhydrolase [unclassified Mesobacillus]|uniref:F510_1955 family glycosylhydrolase n=1 Tax=unclassified Mesobacillus TaxID=2675270 RepID=UPI00204172A2|nr:MULTISPECIES: hypothetical protein [unclassified Mesobacillus]MCM3125915.1 hypothetical protein [Mesobacillus sp. MER 33]MCM3235098.1 hypothetical protein [Mesobacillus sp. MER 48]
MRDRNRLMAAAIVLLALVLTGCADREENQAKQEQQEQQDQKQQEQEQQKQAENQPRMEGNITSDIPAEKFIRKAAEQKVDHVHGIGYPGNDEGLYVASHNGLKMFIKGDWLETAGQNHEYMGFQATQDGFFASGHPEKGSNLKDPLGLIKSTDKGRTLEKIAFYGESDFHFLSAGYHNSSLYLINEEPSSSMERGVYLSRDHGGSWEQIDMAGMEAKTLGMIAVHPENGGIFAMATREGVFITDDFGKNMKKAGDFEMVTAAAFSKESLLISPVQDQKIKMFKLDLQQEGAAEELPIPHLKEDNPITYIAADPRQDGRIAFITILNDLYESEDGGQTWKRLLVNGKIEK